MTKTMNSRPARNAGTEIVAIASAGNGDTTEDRRELDPEILAAWERIKDKASPVTTTASKQAKLQRMCLPYPRQLEAMTAYESARLLGLETRGEPQMGLNIFDATGTGKSTSADQYRRLIERDAREGTIPVLHVSLGTTGTGRQLYAAIMGALGDGFATAGNEGTLRARAMKMMQAKGVQLLILDEAHHAGRSGFRGDITAEVKLMLDMGVVPIVLLGTEEARPILASAKELAGRLMSPCKLSPLDWADEDDRELWNGLVKSLDARMVREGVTSELIGLDDPVVAENLAEVTNGTIGQLMRVMIEATKIATYDHRDHIVIEDLAEAVDNWSIEHGFASSNPLWTLVPDDAEAAE